MKKRNETIKTLSDQMRIDDKLNNRYTDAINTFLLKKENLSLMIEKEEQIKLIRNNAQKKVIF